MSRDAEELPRLRAFPASMLTQQAERAVVVPLLACLLGAVRVRSLYVTASEFHATTELLLVALLARGVSAGKATT